MVVGCVGENAVITVEVKSSVKLAGKGSLSNVYKKLKK